VMRYAVPALSVGRRSGKGRLDAAARGGGSYVASASAELLCPKRAKLSLAEACLH
jgi:hypothetical protein